MKVLITGGGTAGHINPALAIANFIKARKPQADVRFVGTKEGLESTLVPKAGYVLYPIEVYGFQKRYPLKNVKVIKKLFSSVGEAKRILREFQPDIVVGTGGYVSFPLLYAASHMHIKTVIHEQNACPGKTSKLLSRYVDRVLISFDDNGTFHNSSCF